MKIKDPIRSLFEHVDAASLTTVFLTFLLFAVALVVKGFTHDMLLEAAVFLVSVKLILMSYKQSTSQRKIRATLEEMQETLRRMETRGRIS